MALTLEGINLVKQRCRQDIRKPGSAENLRALFKHLGELGNPDLQFVPLDYYLAADQVIADVPCKLYCWFLKKPVASTTGAWAKISDHATTAAAAGDIVIPLATTLSANKSYCLTFPDGLDLVTGATTAQHTSLAGNTDSTNTDGCQGFAIIGAA